MSTDYDDWPALSDVIAAANATIAELAERNRRQANTIDFLRGHIQRLHEAHRQELSVARNRWNKECARANETLEMLIEAADQIDLLTALIGEVDHVGP